MFLKLLLLLFVVFNLSSGCDNFEEKVIDCRKCMCYNSKWLCDNQPPNAENCKCPALETFQDSCNFCFCLKGDSGAGCTKILCPPSRICKNFETKTILCQTCKCFNDNWLCDSNDMAEKCISQPCTEGDKFIQGCNDCTCQNDGTYACTHYPCDANGERRK